MKCPKCGYNSFEHLDSCKKCGNSLTAFKESLGLRALILPAGATMATVAQVASDDYNVTATTHDSTGDETFQWDMPSPGPVATKEDASTGDFDLDFGEEAKPATPAAADPFSFEDDLLSATSPQAEPPEQSPVAEFSFDLPDTQVAATSPSDVEISTGSGDLQIEAEAADNIFGEFAFETPDSQDAVMAPNDAGITQEALGHLAPQADNDNVFGEFSLDIGDNQGSESTLLDAATNLQSPDMASAIDDADAVFGEFSFEEPEVPAFSSAPTEQGNAQTTSDFPFDPFGDLDESAFKEEVSAPVSNPIGELDLDSFLATSEPATAPKDKDVTSGLEKQQLAGNDFDDLFGELAEKK
ncbi:hypothetical protein KI809_11100 [Geobacter pelophilus]|jgi:hypothetical protein|uniref:Zinc ribbon domain-containing protein n=1 Tax=Geoanaerobacter pelophilus TaxID=60036 RepID=A0AAW4L1Q8_9BACT|nr:hypothetical protein [Geoanaerobacter pelophilus]MBT0664848.1 hypothetical protein [Geoanaerobacter pelophilus]